MSDIIDACLEVAPLFRVPKTDKDYDFLVSVLDRLLDYVGGVEDHPLWDIIDIISDRIIAYDEEVLLSRE